VREDCRKNLVNGPKDVSLLARSKGMEGNGKREDWKCWRMTTNGGGENNGGAPFKREARGKGAIGAENQISRKGLGGQGNFGSLPLTESGGVLEYKMRGGENL